MEKTRLIRQGGDKATFQYANAASGSKFNNFLMIRKKEDVLVVSIFGKKKLSQYYYGWNEPIWITFISLKEMEHFSYKPGCGIRTATLVNCEATKWYFNDEGTFYDQKSKHDAIRFFRKEKYCSSDVIGMLKKCQNEIAEERRLREFEKKYPGEREKTAEIMKAVPKYYPISFRNFRKNAVNHYIFYNNKESYCTYCGDSRKGLKALHNLHDICPKCHTPITYKTWNRQKSFKKYGYAAIWQQAGEDLVYRKYSITATFTHEKDDLAPKKDSWKVSYTELETLRVIFSKKLLKKSCFSWNNIGSSSKREWTNITYYYTPSDEAVMYTDNLGRLFRDAPFGETKWMQFLPTMIPGRKIEGLRMINNLTKYPFMEFLQKAGLKKLTRELLDGNNIIIETAEDGKLAGRLMIDGQQLNRMKKLDLGQYGLKWLQEGYSLDDKLLLYADEIKLPPDRLKLCGRGLQPDRILRFMKNCGCDVATKASWLSKYGDYLAMAERRGEEVTDEIIWKNKRWEVFHDRYVEELNREKNIGRDLRVDKDFQNIRKKYKANKKHFEYHDRKLSILVPRKASDITKEGRLQHHCVGASDIYIKRMNEGESYILFLRKKENIEQPFYTIEIKKDGTILQYYGAYDRKPELEIVDNFLEKYKKVIKRRIANG